MCQKETVFLHDTSDWTVIYPDGTEQPFSGEKIFASIVDVYKRAEVLLGEKCLNRSDHAATVVCIQTCHFVEQYFTKNNIKKIYSTALADVIAQCLLKETYLAGKLYILENFCNKNLTVCEIPCHNN